MSEEEQVQKLPNQAIHDEFNMYDETVEVDFFEDGNHYRVTIHPYFKPEKINNVMKNVTNDLDEITSSNIEFPDELTTAFILYHTLIEFSDFPYSESEDITERVSFFTQVINTKYFKECTDTLIQDEINKVFDKVMEIMSVNNKMENMVDNYKEQIQNLDIQSPEVYQKVHGEDKPDEESD